MVVRLQSVWALGAAFALGVPSVAHAEPAALLPSSSGNETIDARYEQLRAEAALPIAGLFVFDTGGMLYERISPGFDATTPVPIASASKWIATALIMTAVDRGELSLDDRVGKFIPEAPPALQPATLRQLLSHTSGMKGRTLEALGPVQSLEESARKLMAEPMASPPGAQFAYGGVSMQIAGLMLERATKRPFALLFSERLAEPLGMRTARVGSHRSWGSGEVPWVAGGMAMSLDDYRRFLTMMLGNGKFGSIRVLSEQSVAAIETNAVAGVPVGFRPRAAADDAGYGLGVWCEKMAADGRCGIVSSAGAFGAYPWLDRQAGRAGIFLTRSTLPKVRDGLFALREASTGLPSTEERR